MKCLFKEVVVAQKLQLKPLICIPFLRVTGQKMFDRSRLIFQRFILSSALCRFFIENISSLQDSATVELFYLQARHSVFNVSIDRHHLQTLQAFVEVYMKHFAGSITRVLNVDYAQSEKSHQSQL